MNKSICKKTILFVAVLFVMAQLIFTLAQNAGFSLAQSSDVPIAPSGLMLNGVPTSASIPLKWTDNSLNEDKFNIYRKLNTANDYLFLIQLTGSNITSYTDTAVTAGTSYDYSVQACRSGYGCSEYAYLIGVNSVGGSDTISPSLPAALVATKDDYNEVDLSWTASTDNVGVAGYEIWRSAAAIWSKIGQTSFPPYIDTTVSPATSYYYKIIAYDAAGNKSSPSALLFLNTPAASVSCTGLNLNLNDGDASYIIGEFVNYTWTCYPGGIAGNVSMWLYKPDGAPTLYNSGSGSTQTMGFSTSNLTSGTYILKACFDPVCATGTIISSQTFTIVSSIPTPTPILTPTPIITPYLNSWIDTVPAASTYTNATVVSGTKNASVSTNVSFTNLTFVLYKINTDGIMTDYTNYYISTVGNLTLVSGSQGASWSGTINTANLANALYKFYAKGLYNSSTEYTFSNHLYFTVYNASNITPIPTTTLITPTPTPVITPVPTSTITPIPTPTLITPTPTSVITPIPTVILITPTPVLTITPMPTIAAEPSFVISSWIEGVPINSSTGAIIGGAKKIYAYGYNSNPNIALAGLDFRLYSKSKAAYVSYAPYASSADGNRNWSGVLETAKLENGNYIFSAKGWYKKTDGAAMYFESNAIDIYIQNSAAVTPFPSSIPIISPYGLFLEFAENYGTQILAGDRKIAVVLNQEADSVAFKIEGSLYAEFSGIKIDSKNYHFIWKTKEFRDGYHTLTAKAAKGADVVYKSVSVKINNAPDISPEVTLAQISPISVPPIIIVQECKDKGFLTAEDCQKYLAVPMQCRQQNIFEEVKCKEFLYKSAMPEECVSRNAVTQEQCREIILVKSLPEECRSVNIITADACGKFLSERARLTPECKEAGIISAEECNLFMEKNFMSKECRDLGITSKEECDYALRGKFEKLGDLAKVEIKASNIEETSGLYQECRDKGITDRDACEKFILAKKFPEDCRAANIMDKNECEKMLFKKYAPKECVEAEVYDSKGCEKIVFKKNAPEECQEAGFLDPEGCKKFMFEKYNNRQDLPKEKLPIECQKAGATTSEECDKIMKAKYLPDECRSNDIIETDQCENYLKKKYLPKECQEAGVSTLTECNKVMFKKYAPEECKKAGIGDEKECNDFMFNKYTSKTVCEGIDAWKCKNAIKEDHLGVIAAVQAQFGRIKEEAAPLFGKSVKAEDFKEKMPNASEAISVKNEQAGLKIVSAAENVLLNEKKDLIQTAPMAVMIDTDGDGLPDDMEKRWNTDPNKVDTDGDGHNDGEEVKNGYDPNGPGKMEAKPAPIDEAIMQNKVLGQPKTEGEKSDNLTIAKVENAVIAQGGKNNGYVFSGKAEPDSVITLYIYSDLPVVMTVKTDEYGNWKYELSNSLVDGDHEVYVAVNDNSGKVLAKSNPLNFFVKEAKAVSAKEFALPAIGENQNNTVKSMANYWIIVALLIVVAVLISIIFIIQRKKRAA